MAREAYEEDMAKLGSLGNKSYKETSLFILQLMRDNLNEGRGIDDGTNMGSGGIDRNGLDLDQGDDEDSIEKKFGYTMLCARGHWRPHENSKLKELVTQYDSQNWNLIAEKLQGRPRKSCRLRWFNQLDLRINKRAYCEEEEERLLAAHRMYGNKWAMIVLAFWLFEGYFGKCERASKDQSILTEIVIANQLSDDCVLVLFSLNEEDFYWWLDLGEIKRNNSNMKNN
ncbi:unnamed protein product [Camellia sinensis]